IDGDIAVLDIGRPPSTEPTDRRIDVSDVGGVMAISDEHGTDVYELGDGELTWSAPRRGAAAVTFSPDGTRLAIVFTDGTEIWDLAKPGATEPLAILPGAQALGWHPRGAGFVIITPDASVEYWPLGATEPAWSVTGRIGQSQQPMILFTSDGNEVVATQSNEADPVQPSVRLFSIVDGSLIGETRELATPVDGWMWFDEEQRRLGIIGTSKNAVALDLVNGGTTDPPFESLTAFTMGYSDALERYVVGGTLGIALHDPAWSGPLERRINFVDPRRLDHRGGPGTDTSEVDGIFRFMSLSEDGTNLLVSGWSAAQGALPIEEYDLTDDQPRGRVSDLTGGGMNGNNGHTLLVSSDGIVMLDDERRPVGDPVQPDGRFSLAFGPSPDGRHFTVSWAGAPDELYRSNGELVTELVVPGAGPGWLDLSFSSDGSRLAGHVYGSDPTAGPWAIWDTDTGEMVDSGTGTDVSRPWLAGDTMYVSKPAAAGELDFDLHRVDPDTRESVGEPLLGQRALRVAVYDDGIGDLIVTHSFDGTVRLWDRNTGNQLGRATPTSWFGGHPRALQLGGDGTVMTRIGPVAVSIWNLDLDTWADVACEFAGRNMTADEWDEFGPNTIDHRATCPQYPINP
ncbi:hypothetical protein, partial [Ilumatobacter sp.]|uniref:WD40 repeat domain-containing protein n=1 Tax=Ilumatobacter sp. TaxID=1967498 RepID=UPI003AF55457